jgi:uncharacterized protein (DUF488 family)
LKETAERLEALGADIRFSPRSRDPRWAGIKVAQVLGDAYLHLKELGNQNYQGGPIDFVDLDQGVAAGQKLLETQSVSLLCACWNVEICHRKPAAEETARRLGCQVVHLTRPDMGQGQARADQGKVEPARQESEHSQLKPS